MIFVDTSALYAIADRGDRNHIAAATRYRRARKASTVLATTNHVVGETYTLAMARLGTAKALELADGLRRSQVLRIVHVDEEVEAEAFRILSKFSDKALSFVDAVSFAFMRQRGLTTAFAFDDDFRAAGFRVTP